MDLILILRHLGQGKNNFWRPHPPHSRHRKLLPSRGGRKSATSFYPPPPSHSPLRYFEVCLIPASHPTMISTSVSSQLFAPLPPAQQRIRQRYQVCRQYPLLYAHHRILQRNSAILFYSQSFPIRDPCVPPFRSPTTYPALPHNHLTIDTVPYMSSLDGAGSHSGASQYQGTVEIWRGPLAGIGGRYGSWEGVADTSFWDWSRSLLRCRVRRMQLQNGKRTARLERLREEG
jgi:hypothetical protein